MGNWVRIFIYKLKRAKQKHLIKTTMKNNEVSRTIPTRNGKSTMTVWVQKNSGHKGQHGTPMLRVSKQRGSNYTWSMPADKLGFMAI
jgi:flagellar hook assembly protein FlgD